MGMALILAVVAVLVGAIVAISTFPSKSELQRMSFQSLGLDPKLLNVPFVQTIVDETSGRVQDRVLAKARHSLLVGAGASIVVVLVGGVLIESDRRRRRPSDPPTDTAA
jgi:hypothetical protein